MDSDDSDFYGDEGTVIGLQNRVDKFNVIDWLQQQRLNPGRPMPQAILMNKIFRLHNPYIGVPYAWQLTETVQHFLQRLPPSTTIQTLETPWIYICNPYIPRVEKGQNDLGKGGNGDEAPDEKGCNIGVVVEGGLERLELINTFIRGISQTNRTKLAMEKEVNMERKEAMADILDLAHAAKVRTGKWMLFCPPGEVNGVWEIVAKATANNELGIAAKVAPKGEGDDLRKDRLICVYTSDFKDRGDVGRVLQKLRDLRLVEARTRAIYYKPDAFTYIGIASGNPWGVRASIYSSSEIFPGH